VSGSRRLEFLRPDHRDEEVEEQEHGDHGANQDFHRLLLHLLAQPDIQAGNDEEEHRDTDINQICHRLIILN
jgi:hypothetical protein